MSYRTLVRLRRLSQILFFLLFLALLLRPRGSTSASVFLKADPLVAITNALATRALYEGLLWSLLVILPTLVFGRAFCGWACPLGALNQWFSSMKSERKRGRALVESNRYKRWHTVKDYVLAAVLAAALVGSAAGLLLDPISLTLRSLAASILPAVSYAVNSVLAPLYRSDWVALRIAGEVLNFIASRALMSFRQPYFRQGFLLGVIFISILALNFRVTRLWCRALCPLGALLGWLSRWSIMGLEKRQASCADCNRCLLGCQGGDDPIPGAKWRKTECCLCLNCVQDCPEGVLRFRLFPGRRTTIEVPDLARRKVLTSLAAGAAAVPLLRATTGVIADSSSRRIRPPGALDEKLFLERCLRCGDCMNVCPTNALQPAFAEAGLEGVWSPVLAPRIGYCEPSCVLCSEVCPTGAIWKLSVAQKGWMGGGKRAAEQPVRIGVAFFDHGRCLPWSMATECIVCEEWCPTSPKAIFLRPAEVVDSAGNVKLVQQPHLDPQRCVGCGACEFACPVRAQPAVYVTSAGESRSRINQILLRKPEPKAASCFPASGEAAGWENAGARAFAAEDLWQYIDGDAERYLAAGVTWTLTAAYRFNGRIDAVADVYVMRTPEGARKIFDAETAVGSRPIAVGDESRSFGPSLSFRRGRYFVRLVAYQQDATVADALIELARAIDERLRR